MPFQIEPITAAEARQILKWRYEPPFDFYNPPEAMNVAPLVAQFLDPDNGFFSVRDENYRFIGFCSFGADGQVAGGTYEPGPLDIGLGMKPDVTSQGKGQTFVAAILAFAQRHFKPTRLRLSVAKFNARAIRVYQKAGFVETREFLEIPSGKPHLVMEYSLDHAVT
ncbi:MAG: GNAT family N-acetyltransferase [Pseudomonadales bacterium]